MCTGDGLGLKVQHEEVTASAKANPGNGLGRGDHIIIPTQVRVREVGSGIHDPERSGRNTDPRSLPGGCYGAQSSCRHTVVATEGLSRIGGGHTQGALGMANEGAGTSYGKMEPLLATPWPPQCWECS
jgi:hypothetical protein